MAPSTGSSSRASRQRSPCTREFSPTRTSSPGSSIRTSWNISPQEQGSSRRRGLFPALYAILGPSLTNQPLLAVAEKLANAGVRLIQLRDKHTSPTNLYDSARELSDYLAPRGVRFILNDRP